MASNGAHFDPDELGALRQAEFAQRLNSPGEARSHAQAGSTIAAGAATALVATGALTDIASEPVGVVVAGAAALGLWLASAGSFASAVLTRRDERALERYDDPVDGAQEALRSADSERERVQTRAAVGLATALAAITASVGTVAAAEATSESNVHDARVQLTTPGVAAVRGICPNHRGSIAIGRVDFDTVDSESLLLEVAGCGELRLNRSLYNAVLKLG